MDRTDSVWKEQRFTAKCHGRPGRILLGNAIDDLHCQLGVYRNGIGFSLVLTNGAVLTVRDAPVRHNKLDAVNIKKLVQLLYLTRLASVCVYYTTFTVSSGD